MAITKNIKIIICLIIVLQTTFTTSHPEKHLPKTRSDVQHQLKSLPALYRLRREITGDSLSDLLDEVVNTKTSTNLNRAASIARASAIVITIQSTINQVFTIVSTAVSSTISNLSGVVTVLQQDIVSPLLTVFNTLAGLTLVQQIQQIYVVVLTVQTGLNIANLTLTNFDTIANSTTTILNVTQTTVNSILTLISNIVP